jgi:integrase/recombinase XerC
MPAILKTDVWDEAILRRRLVGFIDEAHPMYVCALTMLRSGSTMPSALSTTLRLRYYFRYLHEHNLDPLLVTRDDLEAWLSAGRNLSPETRRSNLGTVRCLYEEALDRNLVVKNPTRRLKIGRYTPPSPPALSLRDVETLLATVRQEMNDPKSLLVGMRDNFIFSLLCTIGPRTSEVLRLTVADLHLDDVRVTADIYGKNRKHDIKPLPPVVVEAARLWLGSLENVMGRPLRPEDAMVVGLGHVSMSVVRADTNATLLPMSRAGLFHLVENRLRDLGLKGLKAGPHRLRKTAATLAWKAGADPTDIQRMLGHAHLATTLNDYIKPAMDLEHSASDSTQLKPMGPSDA